MEKKKTGRPPSRVKNTITFHDRCAQLEKKYGVSPEEVLFKLMKHSDPDVRIRAASQILQKKVPTPKNIDLEGLAGGLMTGLISINIGGAGGMLQVGKPAQESQQLPLPTVQKPKMISRKIVTVNP